MTRIAVLGATGRMGQMLVRLIAGDPAFQLTGAAGEPGDAWLGDDAGRVAGVAELGVAVTDDVSSAVSGADVAIDFTLPAAAAGNIHACREHGVALVMGTTGLSDEEQGLLTSAAEHIPLVYGRNMSVGINVVSELVRLASHALGPGFDIEITEAHHRDKVDAPSGTALQLGEAAADGRGVQLESVAVSGRSGIGAPREAGAIGFASVRGGRIVGDHSVMFAADEEIVELRHRAVDRAVFARGALRAAAWVCGRPAGRYSMKDVLGLERQSGR
jgi:4-hydroxy-tetrahydrodipicolinate reductase